MVNVDEHKITYQSMTQTLDPSAPLPRPPHHPTPNSRIYSHTLPPGLQGTFRLKVVLGLAS